MSDVSSEREQQQQQKDYPQPSPDRAALQTCKTPSSLPANVDPKLLRPTQRFLAALERATSAPEKEKLMFRFAAVLDHAFYDVQAAAAPISREGNAIERDVQGLLEAAFTTLQIEVEEQHTVEPPARFAALRALGAFVHGTAPIPTVLSADWQERHVPLRLAALRLLSKLFERGTAQFVFAVRCLSVMALQALQVLQPLDPVDVAVSSVLSSPSRKRAGGAAAATNTSSVAAGSGSIHDDSAVINHSAVSSPFGANDTIMQAKADAGVSSAAVQPLRLPSGTALRMTVGNAAASSSSPALATSGEYARLATPVVEHQGSFLNFETLFMDHVLTDPVLRPIVLELWRVWDAAGIDIRVFTARPEAVHVYMPARLLSSVGCVYRDFVTCPPRPRMDQPWRGLCEIHVKTNITARSEVMFRILFEGYNYGVNAPIQSEVVGCAKRHWDAPAGGDAEALGRMCKDYGAGCISTQYFSRDGYLVVKLVATSFFGVGFTASAWMVFHSHGAGFPIEAEVFHQEEPL